MDGWIETLHPRVLTLFQRLRMLDSVQIWRIIWRTLQIVLWNNLSNFYLRLFRLLVDVLMNRIELSNRACTIWLLRCVSIILSRWLEVCRIIVLATLGPLRHLGVFEPMWRQALIKLSLLWLDFKIVSVPLVCLWHFLIYSLCC